jgi:mannosyltransferase
MLSQARKGSVAVAADASPAWASRIPIDLLLVAGLTALAAVLRFATLTSQSYWFDEAQAAHEMQLSFGALMHTIGAQETSPPLYFVVAWLWAKVFGTGEAGLRSLSALAGTALIPVTYLCGRELVTRRAGVVAAGLAAISPFLIWYSQEAREYMLLGLLCGVSVLFFARCLRDSSSRNLACWAVASGLALLTHFFAGFLVAAEALWLLWALWRTRRRAVLSAVAAVVVVEAALLPLALSDAGHPLGWLTQFPLSTRIQQVPVTFAFNTLYRSSMVNWGLVGAAVLAAVLIVLLIAGADRDELRGAGIAAGVAAFVLLVPLLVALVGHDFYIARALIPAWVPLAVVVGAACTASRARLAGAALAAVLAASFIAASIRISDHPQYQRPNWRGVAAALGSASDRRAVVIADAQLATDPLEIYLPRVPWGGGGPGPVTVSEVDVVGSPYVTAAKRLPAGATLVSRRVVDGYLVQRFRLGQPWTLTPAQIGTRAASLSGSPSASPAVLIQRPA